MENRTTGGYEDYKNSDWYNREAIDALNRQLAGYDTDYDALKRQAEAEYAAAYAQEQDALDARLAQQTAAARNQQAALSRTYDRQRRQINALYDQSAARLNNALTARGLGRSSLVATQGAYLEGQRGLAIGDINHAEADDIAAINSRIAQLTDEAARSRQTMAAAYAQQLENRIGQLRSSNQSAAVSLQLQIAALQQQGYEAYQDWLLRERAQSLDEAEYRQRYGLNEEKNASGGASSAVPAAARTSAATSGAQKQSDVSGDAASALSSLIRSTVNRFKTAISSLASSLSSLKVNRP